ncbi:glycoside hydrolase family 43 protein [Mangrovihabitans endophyticus]|uniref:Xylan 1,4-beta-xylosidase n=1 Tax=Mangrovihabitans endophyticus TaxID=1751298 RepID=A0A8J3FPQ3_9ACTN|nr:glycoside hydrolase family 43 protein [Mangrovihabitans endophyticus]GGK91771.1 xylan 1,4-beta-xylosidase [Mangrovihabitans endophyticus]
MTLTAPRRSAPATIRNPVLPGFHPDPSVLRVGADFYLATSTFEWFPAVRLHHSRDLAHWRELGGALTRRRLVDLLGTPDSGGVWAPCLSYADGLFHLVFTNVAGYAGGFWDTPNFLTTAPSPAGPWSPPVPLHARGFDPSLFHDDGRSWLLSVQCDWRPGRAWAGGIVAQEYDRARRTLTGDAVIIFDGTGAGCTEGPHVYRRDGWYYLVTAEGGTGWDHRVTVARSRSVLGPYEPDPAGPMLTAAHRPDLELQKAGHGSLVDTPHGEWYLAHLTARPLTERGACVLGRETALQSVTWPAGGCPRVDGAVPHAEVPAPALTPHPWPDTGDGFGRPDPGPPQPGPQRLGPQQLGPPQLGPQWSTLRRPAGPDWVSLTERPGHLRLRGGQSPSSRAETSLVARRLAHRRARFAVRVEFAPASYQHLAGLVAYYNTRNWHYAHLTRHDDGRVVADLLSCDRGRLIRHDVPVPVDGPVTLRADVDGAVLRFAHDDVWWPVHLDATVLSDEHATEVAGGQPQVWGFTGAFLGVWCQDLTGGGRHADFSEPRYEPLG